MIDRQFSWIHQSAKVQDLLKNENPSMSAVVIQTLLFKGFANTRNCLRLPRRYEHSPESRDLDSVEDYCYAWQTLSIG